MSPRRKRLFAALFSSLLALALLDVVLRIFPELPGQRLANAIWSRYGGFAGGIYASEPITGIQFMRPGFATVNYWNGYRWHHATDELGFRNPPATPRGVLLLGDSLIYGHGVEETETVAHFLREEHSIAAYNMGRQGACLLDEYIYLRTYLDELAPTDVVLFVFLNDFHDLEVYRTAAEIDALPELGYDYGKVRDWTRRLAAKPKRRLKSWFSTLPSVRLIRALARDVVGPLSFATPSWAQEREPLPEFLELFDAPAEVAAISHYYERIFADLLPRLRERGIRPHLVYLSAGAERRKWAPQQRQAVTLLEQAAAPFDLELLDTRALFASCTECFLPGDGHYTAAGHRRLAEFLAGELAPGTKTIGATPPENRRHRAAKRHRRTGEPRLGPS